MRDAKAETLRTYINIVAYIYGYNFEVFRKETEKA
jgi:hypothetical protein